MRVYDNEIVSSMRRGEESLWRMFVRNAVDKLPNLIDLLEKDYGRLVRVSHMNPAVSISVDIIDILSINYYRQYILFFSEQIVVTFEDALVMYYRNYKRNVIEPFIIGFSEHRFSYGEP
jgi:hypothetical protein